MNLKLKYPQQFKKQHKTRHTKFYIYNLTNIINKETLQYNFIHHSNKQYALYLTQNLILPKKFISFLRKFLRKFFKKHNISCWFRIQLNKVISSKSKNSRMGRGVGTINRMSFFIKNSTPLLLFSNISLKRLNQLRKFLTKRLPVALVIHPIF